MSKTKGEMVVCVMCMEAMGRDCTLPDLKEKHQKAVLKMEEYLANREADDTGPTLISLAIRVDVLKKCIKTRESIMGIAKVTG
ncbi:hypothetical protein LCGC14_2933440 [marine sediment metagenome]|uniref:Uncharacterized protein n=1 Tax=marine sediment metagenome TaxID=412755 RepID=A0A0F8XKQ8_9ZZZZ